MKNLLFKITMFAIAMFAFVDFLSGGSMESGMAMAALPLVQLRNLLTTQTIAVMKETVQPTSFLRSFFPTKTSMTKTVSVEVQRGTEKVAVDVMRGTNSNLNEFGRSTVREYLPPLYDEYFVLSNLDVYDTAIAAQTPASIANVIEQSAEKMLLMRNKIERAIELQAASVLQTGIVTLSNGDNINYNRKAASMVDINVGGDYWDTAGSDPIKDLENACIFLRKVGKAQGQVVNAIMGDTALAAFLNDPAVKSRADIRNMNFDAFAVGLRDSVGSVPIGQVNAGQYIVNIWSYSEFYDNTSNVSTPYIAPGNVIVMPANTQFVTAFAAVPQLLSGGGEAPQRGEYLISDYIDERGSNHEMRIKSAPLVIPVSIDRIYTMKVK